MEQQFPRWLGKCSRISKSFCNTRPCHRAEEQFESLRRLDDRLHRVEVRQGEAVVIGGRMTDQGGYYVVGEIWNQRRVRDVLESLLEDVS